MTMMDLEKTLGALVMPAGLLWLLLLTAGLVLVRRRQWFPACLVLLVWGCYGTLANYYVGTALLAGLERTLPPVDFAQVRPFEAVFVLGGGTVLDPAGEPILSTSGDRVVTAARLWHAGKARFLVASGTSRNSTGIPRDCGQETRTIWRGLGIPDSAIIVVAEPCRITREEIAAYRRLAQHRHWNRMALVSSAFHLPRAMALADKAGLAVTAVGADWRSGPKPLQLDQLVPSGDGLQRSGYACWEYLGRWVGR